jgi:hypothetical protein
MKMLIIQVLPKNAIAMFRVLYVIVNDHPKFNLRDFDPKILKLV